MTQKVFDPGRKKSEQELLLLKELIIRAKQALKGNQDNPEPTKQALKEKLDKLKEFDNMLSGELSDAKRAGLEKLRIGVLGDIEELESRIRLFESMAACNWMAV